MFLAVCAAIILHFSVEVLSEIMVVTRQRDQNWSSEWLRESSWLWIYAAMLLWILSILRPDQNSEKLVFLEELGPDPELTENPEEIEINDIGWGVFSAEDSPQSKGEGSEQVSLEDFALMKRQQRLQKLNREELSSESEQRQEEQKGGEGD